MNKVENVLLLFILFSPWCNDHEDFAVLTNGFTYYQVWCDLLKVRPIYLRGRQVETRNGKSTLFWKDPWLYGKPICLISPVLFDMYYEKNITVHQFLLVNGQLAFTRWLPPFMFDQWIEIVNRAYQSRYQNTDDIISWRWGGKKTSITRTVYDHVTREKLM